MMNKVTKVLVLLAGLSACTPDRQNISWSFDSSVSDVQADAITRGFFSWYRGCRGLSFGPGDDSWATHVTVSVSDDRPGPGLLGVTNPAAPWEVTDEFDIVIWSGSRDIVAVAAHEIGHVMANTPGHVSEHGDLMSVKLGQHSPDGADLEWMSENGQDCGE